MFAKYSRKSSKFRVVQRTSFLAIWPCEREAARPGKLFALYSFYWFALFIFVFPSYWVVRIFSFEHSKLFFYSITPHLFTPLFNRNRWLHSVITDQLSNITIMHDAEVFRWIFTKPPLINNPGPIRNRLLRRKIQAIFPVVHAKFTLIQCGKINIQRCLPGILLNACGDVNGDGTKYAL